MKKCKHEGDLSRRDFLRLAVGGATATTLAGCALGGRLGRPKLTVWSCGGNYDLLMDFNQWFEERAGCRVVYASAPVEHLVSLLVARPRRIDVLVGRSGPGWTDLDEKDRLAGRPEVFALDPYVIIVPPGNPAGIRGVSDLKREDIKTVYAPTASGPSGRVVRFVLEAAGEVVEPGIWEGYVRNAVEEFDCGWKLFPPVAERRAHASVVRLSTTTAPETQGTVEIVPIPVEVMAAMKEGHGAIPQRAALMAGGTQAELGAQYIEALRSDAGAVICAEHGFIHRLSPEAERYQPLFAMRAVRGDTGGGRSIPPP